MVLDFIVTIMGTSVVVQGLRRGASTAGELRSRMPCGAAKKKKTKKICTIRFMIHFKLME